MSKEPAKSKLLPAIASSYVGLLTDIKERIRAAQVRAALASNAGMLQLYWEIGGAVGATFYLEPVATLDVDIFVAFRPEPGSLLLSPAPIFDYLKKRGCSMEGEYIVIGGWPVQFLPPTGPLAEEALAQTVEADVEGTPARVFTAEHLAAIALQTGRAKDKARLLQFIESGALDAARFQAILARHGLVAAWQKFERQFLSDDENAPS